MHTDETNAPERGSVTRSSSDVQKNLNVLRLTEPRSAEKSVSIRGFNCIALT